MEARVMPAGGPIPYEDHEPRSSAADAPFSPARDESLNADQRSLAMWAHVAPLTSTVVVFVSGGVLFFLPLAVASVYWHYTREKHPFIDDHGREAVNFHVSVLIWALVGLAFSIVTCGIGVFVAVPLLLAYAYAGMILATLASKRGEYFRYPACFRVV